MVTGFSPKIFRTFPKYFFSIRMKIKLKSTLYFDFCFVSKLIWSIEIATEIRQVRTQTFYEITYNPFRLVSWKILNSVNLILCVSWNWQICKVSLPFLCLLLPFFAFSCLFLPILAFSWLFLPFLAFSCHFLPFLAFSCLFLPILAFSCLFLPFLAFSSFSVLGKIFPQHIFLKIFKYFLLKHLILYVFVILDK